MRANPHIASLVLQESTTAGSGDFTLITLTGWRSFSSVFGTGSSNLFYYVIRNKDVSGEYESGITYMNSASVLKRDNNQRVIESSNSNNPVTFSAGTKEVICTIPLQNYMGPKHPSRIITNHYIHPFGAFGGGIPNPLEADVLYAAPILIPERTSFTRIGCRVTTAVASSTIRLGIYTDNLVPAAKVFDAGTIDSSTTGAKEINISQVLDAGDYWIVAQHEGGTTDVEINWRWCNSMILGTPTDDGIHACVKVVNSGVLPSSFGTPTYIDGGIVPDIWLRKV